LAAPACPRRERVALTPAFAPDHECSLHGDPWGLLALADTPAPPALTTPAAPTQTAQTEAPAPYAEAPAPQPAAVRRATGVEVGADGRRRLTNDLNIAPENASVRQK
ncbi:MAG TPA: hypothetical protein VNZ44_13070, partial [Pyrinomonadaceae bacterium]|nr:hypothetical protein [Pyrinomonadaceae bacterium]